MFSFIERIHIFTFEVGMNPKSCSEMYIYGEGKDDLH